MKKRAPGIWLIAAAFLLTGCADSEFSPPSEQVLLPTSGSPCDLEWLRTPSDGAEVMVSGEPACELVFDTLLVLRGDPAGVAPRLPAAPLPDGGFVTGTFQPGRLARWDPQGLLVDLIGKGEGSGPGEFVAALDLATRSDGLIAAVSRGAYIHLYDVSGRFIETRRGEGSAGLDGLAFTADGELVAITRSSPGPIVGFQDGDAEFRGSLPNTGSFRGMISAGPSGTSVWTVRMPEYLVRERDAVSGDVVREFQRDQTWFQNADLTSGSIPSQIYEMSVTDAGIVWVLASTPDPNAPAGEQPGFQSYEEAVQVLSIYRDNVVEAFGIDGTLLASRVFDRVDGLPTPIGGGLWVFDRSEDDLTLVVAKAVLTPRG